MKLMIERDEARTPNEGGQESFATDHTHRILGLEGGQWAGKTYAGATKLCTLHLLNAFNKEDGLPTFCASFVVAPNFGDASNYCVPALMQVLDEMGIAYEWRGMGATAGQGRWRGPLIVLPDFGTEKFPSVILILSDEHPEAITGFSAGAGWGDEAARWSCREDDPKKNSILQMYGRVRDQRARLKQILFTYTNEGDTTYIYNEMNKPLPDRKLYRVPTSENPVAVSSGFLDQQLIALTPELAEQYLEGKAVHLAGGLVYNRFDPPLNIDDKITLDPNLPLQLSFDFNITPGTHGIVGQYNQITDEITAIHEIFGPKWSSVEAIKDFVDLTIKINWKWTLPLEVFGDATGETGHSLTRGESCFDIIKNALDDAKIPYRLRIPRGNPPICDRLNAVNLSLLDAGNKVHYKIHPRCKRLIADYRFLRRDRYGEPDKTDQRYSHPSDAEGYRIWFIRPIRKYDWEAAKKLARFSV